MDGRDDMDPQKTLFTTDTRNSGPCCVIFLLHYPRSFRFYVSERIQAMRIIKGG
jgi:hypothetical protein